MSYSPTFYPSKPFVITAVIMLIIGSTLGSIWMMALYGIVLTEDLMNVVNIHRIVQFDGFLTLIIMGMSYLIVPRFRNISIPSVKIVYMSYVLMLMYIISSITISSSGISQDFSQFGSFIVGFFKVLAVGLFCLVMMLTLRIPPKLLRMADYFIGISVVLFAALTVLQLFNYNTGSRDIQLWLMFPVLMIFGVEYKTLPSFIGFIWPRKTPSIASAILLTLAVVFGLISYFDFDNAFIRTLFHLSFLVGAICFAWALNIFAGFDTSKIMQLSIGEKKARYKFTLVIARLSYTFLLTGIILSITSIYLPGFFVVYDMWIHVIAIGFIGLTIALYLPLLLAPILGRTVRFLHFNKFPIWLIIISLGLRGVGDIFVQGTSHADEISYEYMVIPLSLSGWMIVAAIISFIVMIRKSMNISTKFFAEDGTTAL